MRFYLLNETLVKFNINNLCSLNTSQGRSIAFKKSYVDWKLTPRDSATAVEESACSRLAQLFNGVDVSGDGNILRREWGLGSLEVEFIAEEEQANRTIRAIKISGGPIKQLTKKQFSQNQKIEASLEIFGLKDDNYSRWKTNEISLERRDLIDYDYMTLHEVPSTKLPTSQDIGNRVLDRQQVNAFVTISLNFDEVSEVKLKKEDKQGKPNGLIYVPEKNLYPVLKSVNRQILEDAKSTDVVIVAENGVEIKCHKAFLCSQSTVFNKMIQSNLKEGQTSRIEMTDMPEKTVRALLHYIYCLDMELPSKDCKIAMDLMKAGDKYNIATLTESMKELFLLKEHNWFTVEVALDVYLLVRNFPSFGEKLKIKSVEVLKKYPLKLQQLKKFNALFSEDSDTARELCLLALKANPSCRSSKPTKGGCGIM